MMIEIHNPELEAILHQRIKAGNFASVEDMLLNTFCAADHAGAPDEETRKAKARDAAARIRELRRGVQLDRPEDISLRKYAHIGHRY